MLTKLRQLRLVRLLVRRVGVHRVTTAVGLLQAPFLLLLGALVGRVPRSNGVVALGSPLDRFADNAAYLFVHLSEQVPELEAIWVSGSPEVVRRLRSQGYRAERRWSLGGCLAVLRAGTVVYSGYRSDINRWLSAGARAVCLWHGLPVKRVEGAIGPQDDRRGVLQTLLRAAREAPPDYLLAPSDLVTRCFSDWFRVPPERCLRLGYPRDDHLLAHPADPPAALVWHQRERQELLSAPFVVGLFLTWRDDRVADAADAKLLRRLTEMCSAHGALVAYKAHYNVAATDVPDEGCVQLPGDADLHAYLGLCDVLVTDYSSITLDFLLMHRPIVYFMPDLEHYAATRGLQVDPTRLPGVLTRDEDTLLAAVEHLVTTGGERAWEDRDEAFLRELWGDYRGGASEAIAAALLALTAGRRPSQDSQ